MLHPQREARTCSSYGDDTILTTTCANFGAEEEIKMAYPADYKYTKEHEWLKVDGNTGTIGITDYAQNSLGDIVFVELPKVGQEITAGQTFGSVESVKAVSDLFAPVSGTVTEVNEALNTTPEQVNKDANNDLDDQGHVEGCGRDQPVALRRRLREVRGGRGRPLDENRLTGLATVSEAWTSKVELAFGCLASMGRCLKHLEVQGVSVEELRVS